MSPWPSWANASPFFLPHACVSSVYIYSFHLHVTFSINIYHDIISHLSLWEASPLELTKCNVSDSESLCKNARIWIFDKNFGDLSSQQVNIRCCIQYRLDWQIFCITASLLFPHSSNHNFPSTCFKISSWFFLKHTSFSLPISQISSTAILVELR